MEYLIVIFILIIFCKISDFTKTLDPIQAIIVNVVILIVTLTVGIKYSIEMLNLILGL